MKITKKENILITSLYLFNRFGFVSVRFQHIADEVGMSIGNLAYHFKTKEEIIEKLYEELAQEQKQLLADLSMIPLFININHHVENTFQLQKKYSFFYTDSLELIRAYPAIKKKYRKQVEWQTMQLELLVKFNIARGALFEPNLPDSSLLLANRYILFLENWMNFERLKGTEIAEINVQLFKNDIWGLLSPYFTSTGKNEFQQLNSLPFDNWG
ncbi:TetR/AcrR family transcriptional regulator [Arcicella aquatica]|uniref:TetR/AcrR family transcriptional regulator n=1 Tax=Arcicella aquatica TaxID=217141 RepID=A0ABU5QME1_9BACT|nr:TetR/AcrR family transcriptional regulator [Arcicella aquatica]MEA5257965.1 TetR/AcrR family transcriptional regulator [Arcicella aquatica]